MPDLTILTRYGRLGASSRMRFFLYRDALRARGWRLHENVLVDDTMLAASYAARPYGPRALLGTYARRAWSLRQRPPGITWIEKEALPWLPAWLERWLLRGQPYVLDFDDAVFHNYDRHPRRAVRWLLGRRLDELMAGAALVTAGNGYLAARARQAGAPWVEILPTVVDLAHYPTRAAEPPAGPPRVVWIGSPSTVAYLETLRPVFEQLSRQGDLVLRVIGGVVDWPGVAVECVPWSEASEARHIAECHVGVMPLVDGPWERGKCGYKLIQYMACGLPVVASPVGVNTEIVEPGGNGFLAATPAEWAARLAQLLADPGLRARLGRAGRARVEAGYSLQAMVGRLDALLSRVADDARGRGARAPGRRT